MGRIDLINQYGTNKAVEKMNAINDKTYKLNAGIATIKSLAPRMKEIHKVAVACLNNGIALAPRDSIQDRRDNCFITNGWSHYVGLLGGVDYFSGRTTLHAGFGKEGGGAFSWYLEVSLDGEITRLEGRNIDDKLYVVTAFIEGFDEFETKFYAYVDKIIGNTAK